MSSQVLPAGSGGEHRPSLAALYAHASQLAQSRLGDFGALAGQDWSTQSSMQTEQGSSSQSSPAGTSGTTKGRGDADGDAFGTEAGDGEDRSASCPGSWNMKSPVPLIGTSFSFRFETSRPDLTAAAMTVLIVAGEG